MARQAGNACLLEVEGPVVQGLVVVGLIDALPHYSHALLDCAPAMHASARSIMDVYCLSYSGVCMPLSMLWTDAQCWICVWS